MAEENNDKTKEQQNLENLLEKYGNDSLRLATNLLAENASLREKNRTLKASVPGEGSFILSKEEKAEWETFKALNKPMADIQKELSETETLRTENVKLVKRDSLREVAATGWKLGVLEEQLTKFPNAQVSVKKQKASDGKESETAFVALDGKESSLEDFAKEHFADYLPILKAETAQPITPGNAGDPPPSNPVIDTKKAEAAGMAQSSTIRRRF